MAAKQQVDECGHIGDVDIAIGIDVGTDGADDCLAVQNVVDEQCHVADVNMAVVVHVTGLIAVATVNQGDYLVIAPIALSAINVMSLDVIEVSAAGSKIPDGVGLPVIPVIKR